MNDENPFQRHIRENLSGPAQKPAWLKRARRNCRQRERRYAKKNGISIAQAKKDLMFQSEERAQGPG